MGISLLLFQLLDKSLSHVSSILRYNFAQTVQHPRLLVDFLRVVPTNPLKQEKSPHGQAKRCHQLTTYNIARLSCFVLIFVGPSFFYYLLLVYTILENNVVPGVYTRSCSVGTKQHGI